MNGGEKLFLERTEESFDIERGNFRRVRG